MPDKHRFSRLDRLQWKARVAPIRARSYLALLVVMFMALIYGFGHDLHTKLALEASGAHLGLQTWLNLAIVLAAFAAMPFLISYQTGMPEPPLLCTSCGVSMLVLPRLFLPDQVPVAFLASSLTAFLICSLLLASVFFVTRPPATKTTISR